METVTRVHAICQSCLSRKPNAREPIAIDLPHCWADVCCYCGHSTALGIYYRDALKPTRFCRCTKETVYPAYMAPQFRTVWDRMLQREAGTINDAEIRELRTSQYYDHATGKPFFDLTMMPDGDIDEHMEGGDDDDGPF